jgi:hypothetical protein
MERRPEMHGKIIMQANDDYMTPGDDPTGLDCDGQAAVASDYVVTNESGFLMNPFTPTEGVSVKERRIAPPDLGGAEADPVAPQWQHGCPYN